MSGGDWFEEAVGGDDAEDDGATQVEDGGEERAEDGGDGAKRAEDGSEIEEKNGTDDGEDEDGDEQHADAGGGDTAERDGAQRDGDDAVYAGPREADDETVAEQLDEPDDEDPELFEQGFADALDDADIPDPAGSDDGDGSDPSLEDAFGGPGGGFAVGGQSSEFGGDEEYSSDIPRIDLGIDGLDAMIQGGVPERTLMVAIGSAGTGKTTFGLQFLHHALESGENAVFVTLEESRERVVRSATEKGFAFDEYVEDEQLAVVDLDPVEMASSLQTIGGELPRLIEAFGAERLVLDSVSLLEMMYDDRARRRNEIYDFTTHLKDAGVTTMLTSEASEDSPYASRHGIVEYLTDAVFVLQYVRPSDFRETRLAVEIQKIRDANHSRETKPYEITGDGIDVYRQANLF